MKTSLFQLFFFQLKTSDVGSRLGLTPQKTEEKTPIVLPLSVVKYHLALQIDPSELFWELTDLLSCGRPSLYTSMRWAVEVTKGHGESLVWPTLGGSFKDVFWRFHCFFFFFKWVS